MAKILIVDDEPEIRDLIAKTVKSEGHTALTAGSVAEALEVLRQGADLLFLDIDLPGETGVEMVLKIRREGLYQELPIVFVTAYSERSGHLQATGVGAVEVIAKPFRRATILKALLDHLPPKPPEKA